jgi:hypothetical protein
MSLFRKYFVLMLGFCILSVAAAQGAGGDITLTPVFTPDPQTLEFIAGGAVNAADTYGADSSGESCAGFIASAPDHVLTLEAGDSGMDSFGYLRVFVTSDADTTLVIVRDANEDFLCNDDTNDTNPQIEVDDWPYGTYNIYVGTFAEGELANYTISFTELPAE